MTRSRFPIYLIASILFLITVLDVYDSLWVREHNQVQFSGQRALADVYYQTNLGARTPGSLAHSKVVAWLEDELSRNGWISQRQQVVVNRYTVINIIAKRTQQVSIDRPWIILGAHYDSRIVADRDPQESKRSLPVPGANDGASGVAVLLELARVLPVDLRTQVWLVFFDAEDNGKIPGWDWIIGSRAFVASLQEYPQAVVVVDMVGDKDLAIFKEYNSNTELTNDIWEQAIFLGYEKQFRSQYKYRILDDHVPFLQLGVPAVDIIDYDYPYWHTSADTVDKISADSLQLVGNTILSWLLENRGKIFDQK